MWLPTVIAWTRLCVPARVCVAHPCVGGWAACDRRVLTVPRQVRIVHPIDSKGSHIWRPSWR
nr:MAG TPA: hypothetical protein [Caudoviricetes sp.]